MSPSTILSLVLNSSVLLALVVFTCCKRCTDCNCIVLYNNPIHLWCIFCASNISYHILIPWVVQPYCLLCQFPSCVGVTCKFHFYRYDSEIIKLSKHEKNNQLKRFHERIFQIIYILIISLLFKVAACIRSGASVRNALEVLDAYTNNKVVIYHKQNQVILLLLTYIDWANCLSLFV